MHCNVGQYWHICPISTNFGIFHICGPTLAYLACICQAILAYWPVDPVALLHIEVPSKILQLTPLCSDCHKHHCHHHNHHHNNNHHFQEKFLGALALPWFFLATPQAIALLPLLCGSGNDDDENKKDYEDDYDDDDNDDDNLQGHIFRPLLQPGQERWGLETLDQ